MTVLEQTENARADRTLGVLDPATGEVVGRIPAGSPEAADAAVRAARAAQPAWARTNNDDSAILIRVHAIPARFRSARWSGGVILGAGNEFEEWVPCLQAL